MAAWIVLLLAVSCVHAEPELGKERFVIQTDFGDIHMGFYESVAPKTVKHIKALAELGLYTTNHIFRVDKGFVAQLADVSGGRTAPMNSYQRSIAEAKVPLEVDKNVKHDKRGVLSMARYDDPNSGGSSFSILLGPAPHLDMQYTVFGQVTQGMETLTRLEQLETKREGIFVMPVNRITILSTYMYIAGDSGEPEFCTDLLTKEKGRADGLSQMLHDHRNSKLPN